MSNPSSPVCSATQSFTDVFLSMAIAPRASMIEGMICSYPWIGALTQRFGIRKVSAGGAFLAFAATLPFIWLASHGLVLTVLACALFVRWVGLSAVGIPSISAAYASVRRHDLPMATTSLNIVLRLGGPTITTLCAIFLGWRLSAAPSPAVTSDAFAEAFGLLCFLHLLLFLATLRLPWLVPAAAEMLLTSSAVEADGPFTRSARQASPLISAMA